MDDQDGDVNEMLQSVYADSGQALTATDAFYSERDGFAYADEYVDRWLAEHVPLPSRGRVLDLCCGDGVWSAGMRRANPELELFGIDISAGGIEQARKALGADPQHFVVGDAEADLPWPQDHFDLVFARGPGLYNQHDMDRPATIAVIAQWHQHLTPNGRLVSIFASTPTMMGSYTDPMRVALPYNRVPRTSEAVEFKGGKYHHTIQSFLAPFWAADDVVVVDYRFVRNQHVLVTRRG